MIDSRSSASAELLPLWIAQQGRRAVGNFIEDAMARFWKRRCRARLGCQILGMSGPSAKTVKHLFAASGNCCAFPGCSQVMVTNEGTVLGEICHITAASRNGPRFDPGLLDEERDSFANLVLLCPTHHKLVDDEPARFRADTVRDIKRIAERRGMLELTQADAKKALLLFARHVEIRASGQSAINIQRAESIHAKTVKVAGKTKVVKAAHPDSVAADLGMAGYVKYLIRRYQKFQHADKAKQDRGKYVIIYNAIKGQFGRSWEDVHQEHFPVLVDYLHQRIRNSKLGRILGKQGNKLFSSYTDWQLKPEKE